MKTWLYPRLRARCWRSYLAMPLLGALLAGGYGILHDQLTFTLSPDYFTRFKFLQFAGLDPEQPDRLRVAEIGWLATWWVGLIAGWVVVRFSARKDGSLPPLRSMVGRLGQVLAATIAGGVLGFGYAILRERTGGLGAWAVWRDELGVADLAAFARVGYVHNFGYAGALLGLIGVAVAMWREGRRR